MCPTTKILDHAILKTVAYADIFDYALQAKEIRDYLIGRAAPLEEVKDRLTSSAELHQFIEQEQGFYFLSGRSLLIEKRAKRAKRSKELWEKAARYVRVLSHVPFVQCVAVTGGLSMNNIRPKGDIDLFIVTQKGQLWRSRLLIQSFKRWVAFREQTQLCPNYILSEDRLTFDKRNIYTAHELAQMIPLTGLPVYQRLLEQNRWIYDFLPNFSDNIHNPLLVNGRANGDWVRDMAGFLLKMIPELPLRKWQINRVIRNNDPHFLENGEVELTKGCYKGHADAHGQRILHAFNQRMRQLDLETSIHPS